MTITPELMRKAIETAHAECHSTEAGCIHAEATAANGDVLRSGLAMMASRGDDPLMLAYYAGLHHGYRLHQLVIEQTADPVAVN